MNNVGREKGNDATFQSRQIIHEIVQWSHLAPIRLLQQGVEPTLQFAGKERNAQIHGLLQIRGNAGQHRQTSAYVETTDADLYVLRSELAREVHGPGKLVGLYSHECNEAVPTRFMNHLSKFVGTDPIMGFIKGLQTKLDVFPQDLPLGAVERQAVQDRQAIRRHRRTHPLNYISINVVMRRLNENEMKHPLFSQIGPPCTYGQRMRTECKFN